MVHKSLADYTGATQTVWSDLASGSYPIACLTICSCFSETKIQNHSSVRAFMHFTYPVIGIFSALSTSDAVSIIFKKCSILHSAFDSKDSKDCLVCNLISVGQIH